MAQTIQANLDNGQKILLTDLGGLRTTISQLPDGPYPYFFADPMISDTGAVAFFKDGPVSGLFVGSGGPLTTIAHSSNGFPSFHVEGINSAGVVVFTSNGVTHKGIFTSTAIRTDTPAVHNVLPEQHGDELDVLLR